jgi:PIN domain nuclease of toxin-antitoxin system
VSVLLLDTCAAIWLVEGASLKQEARAALEKAALEGESAYVSPMTAWEVANLTSRGRLRLPLSPIAWFDRLLSTPGLALAELLPLILINSCSLPGSPPRDPVDRILVATARTCGCRLVTRDKHLLAYADEGHIQAIAC